MSTQKPSEPARSAELVRVCSVEGCDRQPRSGKAEMCHTHYEQVRTHGHLTEPKPIVRRLEIDLAQQVRCPMGLTVQEVREYLAMDCCPICGEGPWKALSAHLRKHGVKAREVKMWAGLNRTVSLISSSFREEKSAQCKADGWKPPPRLKGNRWGAMSQGLEAQGTPHVELTNVNHGDWGAYRKGCRCDRCRLANSERQHEMRKRRLTRLDRAPHGTLTAYANWGCRCDLCREVWLEHMETRQLATHAGDLQRAAHSDGPGPISEDGAP